MSMSSESWWAWRDASPPELFGGEPDDDYDAGTGPAPACQFCGCTDDRACLPPDGPCYWLAEGVCSAPACRVAYARQQEALDA